jgi:CheY-like chemotaxis protein/HPt (histidine-containing phosphotransfer) domain-containing protein
METANLNADQKHYFDEINKMSSVLMNIINDILDFSKIESGRFEIIPTHFRTRVLFENICSLANFMAKEKKLTFKSYFDEDLPEVTYADENRIWQILINIISNAVKFTEKGTVKFSLKKLVSDDKLFLRAVISDTGHGIKRENSEKIFLSFEQVDRRLHREVPGTGLGLAITKNLTTLMGGTIKVQSVYGEGSTFTVFLPLVEGKVSKLNSELDIQNFVYLKSKDAVKVLIVDDLDINQVVLSGFLEKHNIEPDMAANGREAIKKVNSKKYDLIFMDHMMSDMDGIEATKQIRKIAGYESVPIIAVSANVISEYKALYLRSGMNDFLSKPVNTKRINDILEKWLPEDKLERGNRRQEQRRISKDRESSGRRVGETPLEQKIFNRLSKIEGLDVQTGMNHTGNKIKGYIIVLRQFIDNTAESALKFRKFQKAQDWKSLSILAHAYKGVFAIIGYPALFVWSKKLEYAAKCLSGELEYGDPSKKSDENDIDSIFLPDNFRDAKLICDTESDPYLQAVIMFRDKLEKKVFGGTPLLKRKKIGRKKLRSLLRELEAVCKTYKAKDGEKTIQALRETYVNKKIDLAVSEIIHLVNGFDYENASLKIMTLEAKLKQ